MVSYDLSLVKRSRSKRVSVQALGFDAEACDDRKDEQETGSGSPYKKDVWKCICVWRS